eukprot:g357.t1
MQPSLLFLLHVAVPFPVGALFLVPMKEVMTSCSELLLELEKYDDADLSRSCEAFLNGMWGKNCYARLI